MDRHQVTVTLDGPAEAGRMLIESPTFQRGSDGIKVGHAHYEPHKAIFLVSVEDTDERWEQVLRQWLLETSRTVGDTEYADVDLLQPTSIVID